MEETTIPAFGCSDFSKVRNDVCYAGRNPEAAHEIALGSAFAENYKIGDSVCVTVGDAAREFEVVGFVQSVNQNGELCELSLEGFRSLFETAQTPDIYVYLANAADAAAVAQEYKTSHKDLVAATIDARKMMAESQKMYMDITVILVVVIFVVTILIVLFILYIVIKSLLVKRRQELGIYKAMGYTSTQLMIQTAGSFLPVSIAAILLSSVLALSYMPGIFDMIFRALGVMKNHMEVSFGFLMLFAAIQIAINMIISFLLCMPIRKISAYALIKE
jgi:putative ABC transport system permease protein